MRKKQSGNNHLADNKFWKTGEGEDQFFLCRRGEGVPQDERKIGSRKKKNPPEDGRNRRLRGILHHTAMNKKNGDNRTRTCDPLHVKQMLSQLSYVSIADYSTGKSRKKQVEISFFFGKCFFCSKKRFHVILAAKAEE